MKLLTMLALMLLASCGGGSPSSPHGENLPEDLCKTNHTFNKESNRCTPNDPPPSDPPVSNPPTTTETSVEESLKSIVNEYVSRSNNDLPSQLTYIKLTDEYDGTSIIGGCLTWPDGEKEIRINKTYWNSQSTNRKKNLMFHELGHCIENLGHTDGAGNGECINQSKDNTVLVMDACDEKYEDKYIV